MSQLITYESTEKHSLILYKGKEEANFRSEEMLTSLNFGNFVNFEGLQLH